MILCVEHGNELASASFASNSLIPLAILMFISHVKAISSMLYEEGRNITIMKTLRTSVTKTYQKYTYYC